MMRGRTAGLESENWCVVFATDFLEDRPTEISPSGTRDRCLLTDP